MDRIELTQEERQNIQVMKQNIAQAEAILTAWKFGFQSMLQTLLNRTVQGIEASYTLTPDGTAMVRDSPVQPPTQPPTNGIPMPQEIVMHSQENGAN